MQYPLPTMTELKRFYEESYTSGLYEAFSAATTMKRLTAARRLEEISPYVRSGRWLDVGCSNGVFVEHARERGIDAEGIDLSAVAVAAGRARGLPVVCATSETYEPGCHYDTITAFDVLEHTVDPMAFLRAARRLLAPGGRIALTVPNQASLIRRVMGRRWYFYIPEEHLFYFNPSTIRALLKRTGFEMQRGTAAYKPLTWRYSLLQQEAYNPLLYTLLSPTARWLPAEWLDRSVPLYIGEMMVIAERREPA